MLNKIWKYKWILRSIISTIYFNFHYLPLKQAIKLPIVLYKAHLLKCKGQIKIEGKIKPAMIKLGQPVVSIYPNSGIIYENHGGKIIFKGPCSIGNNSAISIGTYGKLIIGENFVATSSLKIVTYHYIEFKENVLCGWECLFMDTDFHQLSLINQTEKQPIPYAPIIIGKNNWFALKCTIMKGCILSDNNVIASNSLLNKDYSDKSYCLLTGIPAQIKKTGIFRNPQNDLIFYNNDIQK